MVQETPSRFTPDTTESAGPGYGADQPYDPRTPVAQEEQRPFGDPPSEAYIMTAIRDRLSQYEELEGSHIEVVYEQGVVILTGTVKDEAARTVAEQAVASTPGVIGVDNDLKIA